MKPSSELIGECLWHDPNRYGTKFLAVISCIDSRKSTSQSRVRLFEHRSNTGARSPGEELMTPQDLGGRGLLFQCLARLGDQPRVLHRDDRLRREVLEQRDLLVGERAHLLAVDADVPSSASPCATRR